MNWLLFWCIPKIQTSIAQVVQTKYEQNATYWDRAIHFHFKTLIENKWRSITATYRLFFTFNWIFAHETNTLSVNFIDTIDRTIAVFASTEWDSLQPLTKSDVCSTIINFKKIVSIHLSLDKQTTAANNEIVLSFPSSHHEFHNSIRRISLQVCYAFGLINTQKVHMYSVHNEICYASRSVQSRQIRLFFASNTVQNVPLYLWVELSLTFRIFTIWSEIVFTLFWTFLFIYLLAEMWLIYLLYFDCYRKLRYWKQCFLYAHSPLRSSQITRCIEKYTVFFVICFENILNTFTDGDIWT